MSSYSVDVCKALEEKFRDARLHRPMSIVHYDAGTQLSYDMAAVAGASSGRVSLVIEKFVGGGFAGQVYRVRLTGIEGGPVDGLQESGIYAMKILIPPSGFSVLFRNTVYAIGFQGPFQLQTNPTAARAGALWQKFIRRGAAVRFGDERMVNNIHATFIDSALGSCGELSDWVDGRTWRLEVDDHMDLLRCWGRGGEVDTGRLGSPEYRAKKDFMQGFVRLLHDMGAHEFARQYEWTTCKSQPNCLKRTESGDDPAAGLTAVDFRAGLALLPFLPMSPGDFQLIGQGIRRGSLVQFDRGDLQQLEAFMDRHSSDFEDMRDQLTDLKAAELAYRDSLPDITHNHLRLISSGTLWSTMLDSAVTGWKVRNIIDDTHEKKLRANRPAILLFWLLGLVPLAGRVLRKAWAHGSWRRHYAALLSSPGYFLRALKGKMAEKVIGWHRDERLDADAALKVSASSGRFLLHTPLALLPVGLHRFCTSWAFAKERLAYYLIRPVRLYFDADLREQWLRDMVTEGRKKHIITDTDAAEILSQVNEPFIQKYLKSLAVHVCTLPVTQIVSVLIAVIYVLMHPEMPRTQSWGIGLGIIALFQVIPVSPGSLVRGLYVLYLVIRERNFKDYNIAVFLGFFKYIGYLAFPIQMAYRYPTLARFMAGHWATDAVPIVPVFGERGALLEHAVYCWFYNWPLTIRRRLNAHFKRWAALPARYWHVAVCALGAAIALGGADYANLLFIGKLPELRQLWLLMAIAPLLCGAGIMLGCGGAVMWKRIIAAVAGGMLLAVLASALSALAAQGSFDPGWMALRSVWSIFVCTVLSPIGAMLALLQLPEKGDRPSP
ncbi:hypothetical protein ACFL43_06380 [Thermodesulfobacteriota bacterium]